MSIMAGKSIGAWFRQALGGQASGSGKGANGADPRIGKQVIANEGTVVGTITAVWQGKDATDRAPHVDTLGVQRPEQGDGGLLYIPADAVARESAQSVALTVDLSQVVNRGWRYRPAWLTQEDPPSTGSAAAPWKQSD